VDYDTLYKENTPHPLKEDSAPDILVKGGDWTPDTVVGRETVAQQGGRVVIIPQISESSTGTAASTTGVIDRILRTYGGGS
jgi:D-beta-D-heptose 7-phosphate kinase/D-beta-D-heptose 1-phosphate adenosyltransferase